MSSHCWMLCFHLSPWRWHFFDTEWWGGKDSVVLIIYKLGLILLNIFMLLSNWGAREQCFSFAQSLHNNHLISFVHPVAAFYQRPQLTRFSNRSDFSGAWLSSCLMSLGLGPHLDAVIWGTAAPYALALWRSLCDAGARRSLLEATPGTVQAVAVNELVSPLLHVLHIHRCCFMRSYMSHLEAGRLKELLLHQPCPDAVTKRCFLPLTF